MLFVHIIENYNAKADKIYCYASECIWDKAQKRYIKPRISVGHLAGEPPMFVPNKSYSLLLWANKEDPSGTDERSKQIIQTVTNKYGDIQLPPTPKATMRPPAANGAQTAWAVFTGPAIVFGGITARKQISSHIKCIYKIKFKNKYKDVRPELSKSQRAILDALGFKDLR